MAYAYWSWSLPVRRRFWSKIILAPLLLGVGLILYPYLPALKLPVQRLAHSHTAFQAALPTIFKAPNLTPPLTGNWLIIPKIDVKEEIWEGTSLDVLQTHEGVWHQTGDVSHNLVLAGHRFQYLPPNTDTFYNLDKLGQGDSVTLVSDGKTTQYIVTSKEIVTPEHVEILNPTPYPELTLYTCNDWATTHRLVIVAHRS